MVRKWKITMSLAICAMSTSSINGQTFSWTADSNPIIKHKYTADPATMVCGDTLWLFTGEDFAGNQ